MGWYVARLHFPVKGAVGQEVEQFTARHIVLRIHQVEVAMQGVDDDAVALEAVADGDQTAVLIIEVVGIGGELVSNGSTGEIHSKFHTSLLCAEKVYTTC